ncbi:MAG: penicillin acylase family protein [Pirellulales bacterium]|nr:penicillin acylase family protein [Pirellulales bacterium]
MLKRIVIVLLVVVLLVAVAAGGTAYWGYQKFASSLPQLDGEIQVEGIRQPITIERDALGIPTIRAQDRRDLAFGTGYVHGQDRFFQMDLLRRNAAGELAEIIGRPVLSQDRKVRVHRFRHRAERVIAAASSEERAILDAYTAGVNAALGDLGAPPFEYLLLGVTPVPWRPEDSVLCLFSMYLDLQGGDYLDESTLGLLRDTLPPEMVEFLAPQGTAEWDAPVEGWPFTVPPIPNSSVLDLRAAPAAPATSSVTPRRSTAPERAWAWMPNARETDALMGFRPGSNSWAVDGDHTIHGGALVANDMHLGIRLPNIWYRARFLWPAAEEGQEHTITGVTLPGAPAIIVGSNGHIAWGFTNSQGDWADLIELEIDPADQRVYITPDGPRQMDRDVEIIKVLGGDEEAVIVYSTIWGPVIDKDHTGRSRALRWVAHDVEGVNMGLVGMETIDNIDDALTQAARCGAPAQNFVVADDEGRIAWSILGRLPRRVGFDGRFPTSWADGKHRWDGYLEPAEYPRIEAPSDGRIWTANARVVSGENLAKLGHGFYDLGARAKQIRDDLLALDKASEKDMLAVQLDDRAVFLERWQKLLLDTLTPAAVADHPQRAEMRTLVENWGGQASPDSVGFRLVRSFRHRVTDEALAGLVRPCKLKDERFNLASIDMSEGPVWSLVSSRPEHLLDPKYASWDELLLASADGVLAEFDLSEVPLSQQTWGRQNTADIEHPLLEQAAPKLSRWLNLAMPADQLAGDSENLPRIQRPSGGASQRLAVSPGREAEGIFHMPGGQSGHPLSPHYGDGHAAWVKGEPTPFLPGETKHTLVLQPEKP